MVVRKVLFLKIQMKLITEYNLKISLVTCHNHHMRNKLFKMLCFEKPHFQMEMRVAVTFWHFHVTLVPYFLAGLTFTHINRLITTQYSSSWCLSKFTLFKTFVYISKYFHILVVKGLKGLIFHAYYKISMKYTLWVTKQD